MDSSDGPVLKTWQASYFSTEKPSFTYTVQVSDDVNALIGITKLVNQVSISTTTKEFTTTNNQDTATHYFNQTDVAVTKEVSQSAGQP